MRKVEEEKSTTTMATADLTKGMEHLRPYVSVAPSRLASAAPPAPSEDRKTESHVEGQDSIDCGQSPPVVRPRRSPSNPNHRADPSKFGSRYLQEDDNIFEFNAWDSVPLTQDFLDFAESQYSHQRTHPVNDFDKRRFNEAPEKWWDQFYANNSSKFFKDRKWLFKEFPILQDITREDFGPQVILEIGCGAGNTVFPLLENCKNDRLMVHCCDFSKKAVEIVKQSELFDEKCMRADVWDVASVGSDEISSQLQLPPGLTPSSVDFVIMIFVFSALSPSQWTQALRNVNSVLKPGGQILFRDYGRGDLAQVRFKQNRYMAENFYVRGDGTRVYFFDKDELAKLFSGVQEAQMAEGDDLPDGTRKGKPSTPSFQIEHIDVDRRLLVNRQRRLKMYRCWLQARFRKPVAQAQS